MNFIKNLMFSCVAFLVLTHFFAFASALINMSLTIFGAALIVATVFYVFSELQTVKLVSRTIEFRWACLLFLVWPLVYAFVSLYRGAPLLRETVLQFFYLLLVLGVMVYIRKNGFKSFSRVVHFSFWFSVLGIVLDMFFPNVFFQLVLKNPDLVEKMSFGRAGGFYLNPNQAGRFLIFMYLIILMRRKSGGLLYFLFLSAVLLVCVILTGSRSGLLICGMVVSTVIILRYSAALQRGQFKLKFNRLIGSGLLLSLLAGVGVAMIVFGSNLLLEKTKIGQQVNSSKRMDMFTTGTSGFVDSLIEQAQGRFYTLDPYWGRFKESFLWGNGLSGMRIYKFGNGIELVPHNTFFVLIFDYGLLYLVVLSLATVRYCMGRRIRLAEYNCGFFFSVVTLMSIILICFTYEGLPTTRGFYVVLGCMLALRAFPDSGVEIGPGNALMSPGSGPRPFRR